MPNQQHNTTDHNHHPTEHQGQVVERDYISEIRSEEVQDILTMVPNWMIRWGSALILLLILLFLFLSWLIKYPDVLAGHIILTTQNPPIKIVAKTNGQLQKLYLEDGSWVDEGDFIAEIENPLTEEGVQHLKEISQEARSFLETDIFENTAIFTNTNKDHFIFGDIQGEYNQLLKNVNDYQILKENLYQEKKKVNVGKQIDFYQKSDKISQRQIQLAKNDLEIAEQKFTSYESLYHQGIISRLEYYQQQETLNLVRQKVENLKKSQVANSIQITEYNKILNDIEYQFEEEKRQIKANINSTVNNIQNYLDSWKKSYMLTASISGQISYLDNINENIFVQSNTPLFAIIPKDNAYIGHVKIPSQGFGKIKVGQMVRIKLNNYPYMEYGLLKGIVDKISPISKDNAYLVDIVLPNGLKSSYNVELEFKPEMEGMAEIVTENLRLIQRVLHRFKKVLND